MISLYGMWNVAMLCILRYTLFMVFAVNGDTYFLIFHISLPLSSRLLFETGWWESSVEILGIMKQYFSFWVAATIVTTVVIAKNSWRGDKIEFFILIILEQIIFYILNLKSDNFPYSPPCALSLSLLYTNSYKFMSKKCLYINCF